MLLSSRLTSCLGIAAAGASLAGLLAQAQAPIDPNPTVVTGDVSFSGLESPHAVVTQDSGRAIVDYSHFNVLPGGSVQFAQPNTDAAILNRIIGPDPSRIDGSITANGQVYFVNPAGVTFGEGSVIRADTFLAAAGQMTNEDFLADQLNFDLFGKVENFGDIETTGVAGLFGNQVFNAGEIVSRSGVAVLASGDRIYLQPVGSSLAVQVSDGIPGSSSGVGVENSGSVEGEDVLFSAGDAYAVALKHAGTVKAGASAHLYSDGGTIQIDGSVAAHGGRVEIGGTDRGGEGVPRARETHVSSNAVIDVSAAGAGDGGHAVLWADELTSFRGRISGAGSEGRKGGFAEISAANLDLGEGVWDISLGQGGQLLFDPIDVVIDATTANNIVTQMNAGTSVSVDTSAAPFGGAGADAGDITVASPIQVTNTANQATLTLNADRDIVINQSVISMQPVAGGEVFKFTAGRNIEVNNLVQASLSGDSTISMSAAGAVTLGGSGQIDTGTSALSLAGQQGVTFGSGTQIVAGDGGSVNNAVYIEATNGTVDFNGGLVQVFGDTDVRVVAGRFLNSTGVNAITSVGGSGNWQIALPHPYGDTASTNAHNYGGLVSNNAAVYNSGGSNTIPRNEYHYTYQPTIDVTANASSKDYGDAPESGYSGTSIDTADLVNAATYGDVFTQDTLGSSVSGSVALTSPGAATNSDVGTYAIDGSGLTSANGYGFNYIDGTLTVDQRAVTVTATSQDKDYGDTLTLDNTVFTVLDKDGDALLPNGESIDTATLAAQTGVDSSTTADAGTYTDEIRPTAVTGSNGYANSNYQITFVDGDLVVNRRAVSLTAQQQEKYYGNTLVYDGTAFSVTDKDGDSLLPNGELIDLVTLASQSGLDASTSANVATHSNEIRITGASGSNGYSASNYDFSYVDGSLRVRPRPITLTASNQSKAYGDTLALDASAFSMTDLDGDSNLPNGEIIDAVTMTSQTGVDASTTASVGVYSDEIAIVGQTGSDGFAESNYLVTYVDGDLEVDQRAITVTATQQNKDYGDPLTLDSTAFTLLDKDGDALLPNGEIVDTATLLSQTGVDASTTADAGTYTDEIRPILVSGSHGYANTNYAITYVDGDLVVDPRSATLEALQQSKVYGSALTLDDTVFSITDKDGDGYLPNGELIDLVTLVSQSGVDASTTANAENHVNEIAITGQSGSNGFSASNYNFTYDAGDLLVTPRPITLTAQNQDRRYGDALSLDDTRFTVADLDGDASLPNGERIDSVTLTSQTAVASATAANVGTYTDEITITGQSGSNGFVASNYTFTRVDGDLEVTPRSITVRAAQQEKSYGDPLTLDSSAVTVVDADGDAILPNGERIDSVDIISQTHVDASTTANAGTYADEIRAFGVVGSNGYSGSNYAVIFEDGDLVVIPRAVSLNALQQEKVYGTTLTLDGTVFSVLDQDGDALLPNRETIDLVSLTSRNGAAGSTTAGAGTHSEELQIAGQSGSNGFSASNYAFAYNDGNLLVTPRAVTLTALPQSKSYGSSLAPDGSRFSLIDVDGDGALPNGEVIDLVTLTGQTGVDSSTSADVGTYTDELRIAGQTGLNGFASENYAFTYVDGDLQVTPRAISVTASAQTKSYGDALTLNKTAFTILDQDGDAALPNGESIDSLNLSSLTQVDLSTTANAGTYTGEIRPSGLIGSNGYDSSNYNVTFVDGDLVVSPRAVTLTALDQSKVYGEALALDGTQFVVLDKDGDHLLPNGETIDQVLLSSRNDAASSTKASAGTRSGEIQITGQSGSQGFAAGNYAFTYADGDLRIEPRAITLTAGQQRKAYGDSLALDGAAFTILDRDGDKSLPNDEVIESVALKSATGVAASTTASADAYSDEIRITGQSGSNGFVASNYSITHVDGELVVDPRAITVTAGGQSKTYGDGLTLDGDVFSLLDQDGDALLPNGETIVSVALASRTGVAANTAADAATYSDEIRVAEMQGGNGYEKSNYSVTLVDGDMTVTPRAVTLTAQQQNKVYGDALSLDDERFALRDQDGDALLPNGERIDTVTLKSRSGAAGSTTASAGHYDEELRIAGQSGSKGFKASNYLFTYEDGDLQVSPRSITLSATEQRKSYGDTLALDATAFDWLDQDGATSLPNGENIETVALSSRSGATVSTTASAGSKVGDIQISGQTGSHGFDASNYTITYVDGDLVVEPRAITLTALPQEKTVGEALSLSGLEFTLLDLDGDGLLPNAESIDRVDLVSAEGRAADLSTLPGTYADNLRITGITGGGSFDPANYAVTYVSADLLVNGTAPPASFNESFSERQQENAGFRPHGRLAGGFGGDLNLSLLPIFQEPDWHVLTHGQRQWVLGEYERAPAERVNRSYLRHLLNEAKSR